MTSLDLISHNVAHVLQRIHDARSSASAQHSVTLEIAGKTRTSQENFWAASALRQAGVPVLIGHNRVQEARECEQAIRQVPDAQIHLIGPLQTNKINHALACVDVVETVDSPRLVEAIDKRAERELQVFIQVNTSGEDSKSGCLPEECAPLLEVIQASTHLRVAGLMTIGLNSFDEHSVRRSYEQLRILRDDMAIRLGVSADALALSMGMSRDLEWAIAEGATIVRVGTDIFGPRA